LNEGLDIGMCKTDDECNQRLAELWPRLAAGDAQACREVYPVLWSILSRRRFTEYGPLIAAGEGKRELFDDFFADKIWRRVGALPLQINLTWLSVTYRNYLLDRLAPVLRHARHHEPLQTQDGASGGKRSDESASDGDFDTEYLAVAAPGQDPADQFDRQWISPDALRRAAAAFLNAKGRWAHLEPERWWIRLYLARHACAEEDGREALSTLARRRNIRNYAEKARWLGITHLRPGAGAALKFGITPGLSRREELVRRLAAFRATLLGQWVETLDQDAGDEDPAEQAARIVRLTEAALQVLCCAALKD
jgi:hypothetical protein